MFLSLLYAHLLLLIFPLQINFPNCYCNLSIFSYNADSLSKPFQFCLVFRMFNRACCEHFFTKTLVDNCLIKSGGYRKDCSFFLETGIWHPSGFPIFFLTEGDWSDFQTKCSNHLSIEIEILYIKLISCLTNSF